MKTCSIPGCDNRAHGRGWCRSHYMAWWRYGDPLHRRAATPQIEHDPTCSVVDCERPYLANGLCQNHYMAARRKTEEHREWKREYNLRPDVKAKDRARLRRRYATDPAYRQRILDAQATERQLRPKIIQSRWSAAERRMWKRLVDRYGSLCAYCGENSANSLEHIIPRSRGGTDRIGNLLPVCQSCNSSKGDKLLIEWRRWRGDLLPYQCTLAFRAGVQAEREYREACHREEEASEPQWTGTEGGS